MARYKLNRDFIQRLTPPDSGQAFYRDSEVLGFALRITDRGAMSFILETRIDGKNRRITLGKYGILTAQQARELAKQHLGEIASGRNPLLARQAARARKEAGVTLGEVFARYLTVRGDLKPSTVTGYRRNLQAVFADWLDRPLASISKDTVQQRHAEYSQQSASHADAAMRLLRALFNYAQEQYENADGESLFPVNPVRRLSRIKAWHRLPPRSTLILKSQLPAWFAAVDTVRGAGFPLSATVADLVVFLMLTGMRRGEALHLTWADVDFAERTVLIRDPKNHIPLLLPLSDYLYTLLQQRAEAPLRQSSAYVFPSSTGGVISDPRKQMQRISALSGVSFTLHDLRRTFITIAESLELSSYAIKRLINHKQGNDVTAGYIVMDAERLREPMERITTRILGAAGRMARPDA